MNLAFGSGKKFIMTIGEDGAILTFIEKNKLVTKLFAASASAADRREINALFLKNPTVPIVLLLDSLDQTYTKQLLPAVSSFSIGKLVKTRLERDFAKTDLKGAVPMGRDTEGRKDWIYMFVSTPTTPAIIDWLEYFRTLPNRLDYIGLLPIEMENVANDINKHIFKNNAEKQEWQFVVTHNKTSGFRQTILHNNKVLFTRLIRQGKDNLPDIIAGNIEQEIINTIDYLRRLGLSDEKSIDITIIVSKDIKNSLATTKIRGKNLILFTPFEIAKILGYESASGKDDKFADIILATVFAQHKAVLRLDNPREKNKDNLYLFYKISTFCVIGAVPTALIYSGFLIFNIVTVINKIKTVEDKKASIEKEWKSVKNTGNYSIDDANKVTDAIVLRRKILNEEKTPIDFVEKLANMNTDFISLESLTWNYDKDYSAEGKPAKIASILNIKFSLKDSNLESMFKNYDLFSNLMNKAFSEFQIDISKLPDKITFDNKNDSIPIQIKINSKDQQAGAPVPGAPPPANGGK